MSFDDIAGNDYAKEIINQTFVLPSIMKHIYKGNAKPWQSILLYGVSLHYLIKYSLLELVRQCLHKLSPTILILPVSGFHRLTLHLSTPVSQSSS